MRPLLADRYEVKRILDAPIAPSENPGMAKRVNLLAKFGPGYGLGGVSPANEPGRVSDAPPPKKQAPTADEIVAHYANNGLGFKPKTKRYDERSEDRYDNGDGAAA